ncbi:MAG: MBL fold metallo-hydrolase RNA specificity domain-containing protein [Thermoplasmatota archaeon]
MIEIGRMDMEIKYESGICLKDGKKKIILDPTRQSEVGVVTHGHLDHLVKDAYMTIPTLDILEVRKGEKRGKGMHYATPTEIGGFQVTLYPAGHVFGSSMVKVEDVLYTGDFNPYGGRTCKRAAPYDCETLIIESTYGKPSYRLPNKDGVTDDFIAWTRQQLDEGPVVFGAYKFGKAQEVIALLNELGEVPYVTEDIAELCDVYNKYDQGLEYQLPDGFEGNFTAVVPPGEIKRPIGDIARIARKKNGSSAYLSGWCAFFPYFNSMDIDAQFPFSDHAGFDELLKFIEGCDPSNVLTVHGSDKEFAEVVEKELGIDAEPLKK